MYQTLKKIVTGLAFAGGLCALVVGCDSSREITLAEEQVQGSLTVKVVQNVRMGNFDTYRLEVYDSEGTVRLRINDCIEDNTYLKADDGRKFTIKDGKGGYEPMKTVNKKSETLKPEKE